LAGEAQDKGADKDGLCVCSSEDERATSGSEYISLSSFAAA
jgi:hypothetical protein